MEEAVLSGRICEFHRNVPRSWLASDLERMQDAVHAPKCKPNFHIHPVLRH